MDHLTNTDEAPSEARAAEGDVELAFDTVEPDMLALPEPSWRVGGASVRGTAHVTGDLPCQDAHEVHATQVGGAPVLIAAVSDGAGSARHAEVGSAAVCRFVIDRVEHLLGSEETPLGELDARQLVVDAAAHLAGRAQALGCSPRDLACTLLLSVVLPTEALFVQVGDGAMVFGDDDLQIAVWPDSGEYANETYFVTDARAEHIHVRHVAGTVRRVALLSDGLQMLCLRYRDRAVHTPFFTAFFGALGSMPDREAFERALANTLGGERVNARTDDDKTLLLAHLS